MSLEELRRQLLAVKEMSDIEAAHGRAEDLLLAYIGDPEVTRIWNEELEFWYA